MHYNVPHVHIESNEFYETETNHLQPKPKEKEWLIWKRFIQKHSLRKPKIIISYLDQLNTFIITMLLMWNLSV